MINWPISIIMFSIIVLILSVAASVQGECDKGCDVQTEHYKEMGCEPVFAKSNDCCPSHYDCAKVEARPADQCFVDGKVYNFGESIEVDDSYSSCISTSCQCNKRWNGIVCAIVDCPEYENKYYFLKQGCYYPEELTGCCASGKEICPPFDKHPKCEVDGKTYYEGQMWWTKEGKTHLKCVCKEGFKGKLEAPFCAEDKCGIEITYSNDFRGKCAPVFYKTGRCPSGWECLKDGDEVEPNQKGTTSEQKCSYGEKKLNIGDKLLLNQSSSSPKIDCECKIPPLITCIKRPYVT